jgi:hypothetical protein
MTSHCMQCDLTTRRSLRRYAANRAAHKIEQRYPRLIRLMQFAACLSLGEASACIRDYVNGYEYSSEAVNAYGGASQVIERAVQLRTNYPLRTMLRGDS